MMKIIIQPRTEEESLFFEYLAQRLNTPYVIATKKRTKSTKKPSDYIGSISVEKGEDRHEQLSKRRAEWDRDI